MTSTPSWWQRAAAWLFGAAVLVAGWLGVSSVLEARDRRRRLAELEARRALERELELSVERDEARRLEEARAAIEARRDARHATDPTEAEVRANLARIRSRATRARDRGRGSR